MSALGQKRTWRPQFVMSALPPKADIRPCDQDVCFGPQGDICGATNKALFDHLVCDGEHRQGHLDAECSRRLQVDDEVEFG